MATKLACFDLDDTLNHSVHSVMYLAIINNKLDILQKIEKQENQGIFNWVEADYYKAKLAEGLHVCEVKAHFDRVIRPIDNIRKTVDRLHAKGITTLLITAGPKQVAQAASELWGVDSFFGSDYEVKDGFFTGKIVEHLGAIGKLACLKEFCLKNNYLPADCIAVGDGDSDIPLFEFCGTSIAINYSQAVIGKATHYLTTDDLSAILAYIT